ncbi:MAG: Trk system potassium transport protein TrkA, partial [Thiotrichales bacterium]
MKIIILGAGSVGATLADRLATEKHDITLVDTNAKQLQDLQEHLDINVICGNAASPRILARSGAGNADMLIAVTNNDEINIVACQICYSLFQTPLKVTRIRNQDYLTHPAIFTNKHIPIDVLISPEQLVTEYIQRLIKHPEALQ